VVEKELDTFEAANGRALKKKRSSEGTFVKLSREDHRLNVDPNFTQTATEHFVV